MKDWQDKLDSFLKFNDRDVLAGAGIISRKAAISHAKGEYESFAVARRALLEAEGEHASIEALETLAEATEKQIKGPKNET